MSTKTATQFETHPTRTTRKLMMLVSVSKLKESNRLKVASTHQSQLAENQPRSIAHVTIEPRNRMKVSHSSSNMIASSQRSTGVQPFIIQNLAEKPTSMSVESNPNINGRTFTEPNEKQMKKYKCCNNSNWYSSLLLKIILTVFCLILIGTAIAAILLAMLFSLNTTTTMTISTTLITTITSTTSLTTTTTAGCHVCSGSTYAGSCNSCTNTSAGCIINCLCNPSAQNTTIVLSPGINTGCLLNNYNGVLNCTSYCA